jgi:two-component system, LuxR family, sensor kinase FixL
MNTLVFGSPEHPNNMLLGGLATRQHTLHTCTSTDEATTILNSQHIELIFIEGADAERLQFCRQVRFRDSGDAIGIYFIVEKHQTDLLPDILDAGADDYLIESVLSEQRLDTRLSFVERYIRHKIEHQITQKKLRDSEARARSILETTVDAIITIDQTGVIRSFNTTAQQLFGFEPTEVIGHNVKILMPEPYKREHDDYMHNYQSTGHRKIIGIGREVTGRRKDGSTFPMYLAVSEVRQQHQRFFTGIIRDMTEQHRLEQEVLRISEHERRRIGQDLHDGLGQMLTGIGLISANIQKRLEMESHPAAAEIFEVTKLIKESDQYARELARGLIPVEFDTEGLYTALERLTNSARKLFNIECRLDAPQHIKFEDSTQLIHLYRIAQEAVNNAVKHGNCTHVDISVVKTDNFIRLRILDNGVGFSEHWDGSGGLGVRIMQFRARLIGAILDIGGRPGEGAVITCTMPIYGNDVRSKSAE